MDLARPSYPPILQSPDISHISETNMDMSPKELKKEKIPESDISYLNTIVIDDLSNYIIIHDTQNAEIPGSPPPQSTTQSIKPQEYTRAKNYPIVIPESQQNKIKKEPPPKPFLNKFQITQ